jgi:signal transduction histidine kinase/ActR/RegA family two-component response regulator
MGGSTDTLFDYAVWAPALEKFGAVTQLSVALYDADEQIVCGPVPATPLYEAFHDHGYIPPLFAECVRQCLEQLNDHRPPVVVTTSAGLAVVGASLLLDRRIVGAVVGGYALVNFCESVAVELLARKAGIDFQRLWAVARRQQPVPAHRLVLHGELLQVLGDTLLRENILRRQSEDTANQLIVTAAAKEEFLAVLSHELRTPLTPILGWTGILKMQSDPKIIHAAQVIERNALFQLRLVEDLLELTRATRGKLALNLKVLCINDLVRSALEAIADAAHKKDIGVQFVDAPEPVCINADADRLQQILRNVLLNGVKFTPAGGTVTIALSSDGENAVVRVRDTGEGIAPEFLPHVFEMFQQQEQGTRRTHPGLGIGLALVRHLTEAHGGAVSITSEGVGRGTEVTIQFPLVAGLSEAPESPAAHVSHPLALDGLRILVVEDTEDALEAMCVTLERFGADVVTAKDGVEALERTAGDDVDLILCDLRMPRMDGFEFIRELQDAEGAAHPPVIAVSGLAGSADHIATRAAGFTGHIDKPFDDVRLLDAVAVALAHRSQAPRSLPLRPGVAERDRRH